MANKFTVKIQSERTDGLSIILSDFTNELNAIGHALRCLDKSVSGSKSPTSDLKITNLGHGSPAIVEIEVTPKKERDYSERIVGDFMGSVDNINSGRVPMEFDQDVLNAFSEIGATLKKHPGKLHFSSDGHEVGLTEPLAPKVKKLEDGDEIITSSVSGILESLNIHDKKKKKFTIYPIAGPTKIDCFFPKDLFSVAINSVNKYMHLKGRVKYKKKAKYPHEIYVREMEVYPDETELPTIFDLRGIAPEATGDLSSEEFVGMIRYGK